MNRKELLLNPGPTNTSRKTKEAQTLWSDVCHRTDEFLEKYNTTRQNLLRHFHEAATLKDWSVALIGGSGTLAMEALISSLLDDVTIINAGKYGQRAMDIAKIHNVNYCEIKCENIDHLKYNQNVKDLYFVQNETTTGEAFEPNKILKIFPNARLYLDATSAFGASDYSSVIDNIDAISFCSNKCLQSTPGLGIVIWRRNKKLYSRTYYSSLKRYLDGNNIPFTVPTQSIGALASVLINKSNKDIFDSRRDRLIKDFENMGIKCVNLNPSNSIIGFKHPNKSYEDLKKYLVNKKIVIYSGIPKVKNSFRVATMSVDFDNSYNLIIEAFNDSCIC